MDTNEITLFIEKYVNGALSPSEERDLMNWYRSEPVGPVHWPSRSWTEQAMVKQAMYGKITDRMRADGRRRLVPGLLKAAAVVAGITAGACLLIAGLRTSPLKYAVVTARAGEIRRILLPDSSTVWLNAGSTLRYPERCLLHQEVELEGEAFFDVKRNPARSFTVRSGGVTTIDLGTKFNIRAWHNSSHVVVSLESGKIRVDGNRRPLATLSPGQELTVNRNDGSTLLRKLSPAHVADWKSGTLDFNDQSLLDITDMLAAWYGVRFVFQNESIKRCIYNASFDNTIPLDKLLKMLCSVNKIDFTITGSTITLGGDGCR